MATFKQRFLSAITLSFRDSVLIVVGALIALIIYGGLAVYHDHQTILPYQKAGVTASWLPSAVTKWKPQINAMAEKYNIDANVIAILMTMESAGNPKAKSEAGAVGLMQITSPTAGDIAARYLKTPVKKYDLTDGPTSIEFGTAYLAMLRDEYGDTDQAPSYDHTVELIAAAYNGGFGAANSLEAGKGLTDTQTVVYSRDAFNMWRERVSSKSPTFDRWKERGGQDLITAAQKQ